MLEEVPALKNENNHLNSLAPYAMHCTLTAVHALLHALSRMPWTTEIFSVRQLNWSALVHRQSGEEWKSNSINISLRIWRKEIFYHTNWAAHFNSAINNQANAGRKIAFFIFLSDGMRKENLEILVKSRLRIRI